MASHLAKLRWTKSSSLGKGVQFNCFFPDPLYFHNFCPNISVRTKELFILYFFMFGFCSPSYMRQSLTDSGAGSKSLSPPPQLELTCTFYPCSGHLRSGLPTPLHLSISMSVTLYREGRRVDLDDGTLWLKDWDYSRGPVCICPLEPLWHDVLYYWKQERFAQDNLALKPKWQIWLYNL